MSVGYRHMVRFFVLGIWDVVADLGYSHVMRLDEDSFLWSPIRYNLFEFMRDRRLDYAYRLGGWERAFETRFAGPMDVFHSSLRQYALDHQLDLRWLLDTCLGARSVANFSIYNCGNAYVFYNNFFVTRVGFWRRPDVQAFLRYVNSTESIYYERVGDALWHSAAAALFMHESRLHMFHDWAYEHATLRVVPRMARPTARGVLTPPRANVSNRTCLHYGGMVLPWSSTPDNEDLQAAQHRMASLLQVAATGHCDEGGDLKDRACLNRSPGGRITGFWQGTGVSVEQTRCSQEPQPFHCSLPRHLSPTDRLHQLQLLQRRQMCSNWCPDRPAPIKRPTDLHATLVQKSLERNWSACTARSWRLWTNLQNAKPVV